jgi:hypothetical protein
VWDKHPIATQYLDLDFDSGVAGRFVNYFGVPETSLMAQFDTDSHGTVEPEPAGDVIDSADVCRYIKMEPVTVNDWTTLSYNGRTYAYSNKFDLANISKGVESTITAIVSYDRDVVTLYIVSQDYYDPQGIEEQSITNHQSTIIHLNGVLLVRTPHGLYTLNGQEVK